MPSFGAGGAEKFVSTLLPFLVKDYHVDLVLFYDIRHFDIPPEVDVTILNEGDSTSLFSKLFKFFFYIRKYSLLIKQKDIHISFSLLTRPNIINGIISYSHPKVYTVISERCFPSIAYRSHRLRYWLYSILIPIFYNRANILFSNSVYINEDLQKNFGLKIPTKVIYNSIKISPDAVYIDNSKTFHDSNVFNVVTAGTLYQPKNHKLLIDAAAQLDVSRYRFSIIGAGVLMDQLKNQANGLGLDNIEFIGRVNNVLNYLYNKQCFVLTSNTEGFPNVLLEAMSVGLPVISTNCLSGPLELLNNNEAITIDKDSFYMGKYGILVNVNDSIGIAKAIEFLKLNYDAWKMYSLKSIERSKSYADHKIYKEINDIILKGSIVS